MSAAKNPWQGAGVGGALRGGLRWFKRRRNQRRLAAAGAVVVLVGAAVATWDGPLDSDRVVALAPAADGDGNRLEGGIIRYAHLQEPPCVFGGWIQQAFTARQVLDSLVQQTEDGSVVPWIAESWEQAADGKSWTFRLKDGVKFTDGTDLDAAAVAYNFDYWQAGGNGTVQAHIGEYYDSADVVDRLTVRINFKEPFSPFLQALSQGYFGLQSPTALETRSEDENCEQPIGSGPFKVVEWKRGEKLVYERNDEYNWAPANAKHQGPAYVAGIEWSFVPDNTSRYGSLISGESDAIGEVPTVDYERAGEKFQTTQYVTPGRPVVLSLNTVNGPFTDKRVRQAFGYATDRVSNVASAFHGVVPYEGNGTVSQTTPGYNAEAAKAYPYDAAKAEQLLDAAGWTERAADGTRIKDGKELTVKIVYGLNSVITPEGNTALQNLQEQAKESGFKVNLRPVPLSELFSGTFSDPMAYDAQLGYWTSPHAGILHINYRPHLPEHPNYANTTFYNNEEIYETIRKGNSARTPEEAHKHYRKAQQELTDEATALGLYTQTSTLAVHPDLRDVWLEASQGEPVFHDAYFVQPGTGSVNDAAAEVEAVAQKGGTK